MAAPKSQPSLDGPFSTVNCQVSWSVNNGYIPLNDVPGRVSQRAHGLAYTNKMQSVSGVWPYQGQFINQERCANCAGVDHSIGNCRIGNKPKYVLCGEGSN